MRTARRQYEKVEPNMTPILDMVFQLITFFMLVMNFKAASLETNLKLPVIGSAMPSERSEANEPLVLNVDQEGRLLVYGEEINLDHYIASETQLFLRSTAATDAELKLGDELPVTVVVRADRDIPFRLLNRVIQTCQAHGYRKFQYRAMTAELEN